MKKKLTKNAKYFIVKNILYFNFFIFFIVFFNDFVFSGELFVFLENDFSYHDQYFDLKQYKTVDLEQAKNIYDQTPRKESILNEKIEFDLVHHFYFMFWNKENSKSFLLSYDYKKSENNEVFEKCKKFVEQGKENIRTFLFAPYLNPSVINVFNTLKDNGYIDGDRFEVDFSWIYNDGIDHTIMAIHINEDPIKKMSILTLSLLCEKQENVMEKSCLLGKRSREEFDQDSMTPLQNQQHQENKENCRSPCMYFPSTQPFFSLPGVFYFNKFFKIKYLKKIIFDPQTGKFFYQPIPIAQI